MLRVAPGNRIMIRRDRGFGEGAGPAHFGSPEPPPPTGVLRAMKRPTVSGTVDPESARLPGGVRVLRAETFLPLSRKKVFRFFSDAGKLEQITPPGLRFDIRTPLPIRMHAGTLLDYRLRLLGIPFHWRTEITEWDPPRSFADRQLRGPYRLWFHRHDFQKVPGGTRMVDEVLWKLPLRPFGEVAAPWVRWQLGSIFRYRRDAIARILAGD